MVTPRDALPLASAIKHGQRADARAMAEGLGGTILDHQFRLRNAVFSSSRTKFPDKINLLDMDHRS